MYFLSWLNRSFGRIREGAKRHLIESAKLIGVDDGTISQMKNLTDEACEALFIEKLENMNGGVIDWRAKGGEVIQVVEPLLNSSERALLGKLKMDDLARPADTVRQINKLLHDEAHVIRAIDSFGDAVIVVVIDKCNINAFDDINKYWLM